MTNKNSYSPLRYPGGKSALADFLANVLCLNDLDGGYYFEPYAGSAAVGIMLLSEGLVKKVFINDLDYCVYCFWYSVLNKGEQFIEKILNIKLDVQEWNHQRDIYSNPKKFSKFDVGFASFYLNRCNRSGIMKDAGPIGGRAQNGKWKINARFNRTALADRIKFINKYKGRIQISCLDGIRFLSEKLPLGNKRKEVLVYLDPPYFSKGPKLYMNSYTDKDHTALSLYMMRQKTLRWIMTYDNESIIKSLYKKSVLNQFSLNYSAQTKKQGQELLITPNYLKLPSYLTIHNKRFALTNQ